MLSSSAPDLRECLVTTFPVSPAGLSSTIHPGSDKRPHGRLTDEVVPRPSSAPTIRLSDCDSAFEEIGDEDSNNNLGDIFSVLSIDDDFKSPKGVRPVYSGTNKSDTPSKLGSGSTCRDRANGNFVNGNQISTRRSPDLGRDVDTGRVAMFSYVIPASEEASGEDSDSSYRSNHLRNSRFDVVKDITVVSKNMALGEVAEVGIQPSMGKCLQAPLVTLSSPNDETSSDSNDEGTLPVMYRNRGAHRRRHSLASITPDQITRMLLSRRRGSTSGQPIPYMDSLTNIEYKTVSSNKSNPMVRQWSADSKSVQSFSQPEQSRSPASKNVLHRSSRRRSSLADITADELHNSMRRGSRGKILPISDQQGPPNSLTVMRQSRRSSISISNSTRDGAPPGPSERADIVAKLAKDESEQNKDPDGSVYMRPASPQTQLSSSLGSSYKRRSSRRRSSLADITAGELHNSMRRGSRGKILPISDQQGPPNSLTVMRQSRRSSISISNPTRDGAPPGPSERADIVAKLAKDESEQNKDPDGSVYMRPASPQTQLSSSLGSSYKHRSSRRRSSLADITAAELHNKINSMRRGSRGKILPISDHQGPPNSLTVMRQSRSSISISNPTRDGAPPGPSERADIVAKLGKRGHRRSSWAGEPHRMAPASALARESSSCTEDESEQNKDPYILTLHFITDPGQSHPLRMILRPLIESIVPKLNLFNFVERSEGRGGKHADRDKAALVPTLGVVLLLQEEFGMERILEAQKYLRSEPWELHHRGKVGSNNVPYPTNNQNFYAHQTREDSALWAVRQVHFGKDQLRFQLFVSDDMWAESISFYATLLSRQTHIQKDDFCYFLVFCSQTLNLEVQLALKKLPPGFKPQFLDSTILQFKVEDMCQLVPVLPRVCIPISDKRWQTADPDGNKVLLFKDSNSSPVPVSPDSNSPTLLPDTTSRPSSYNNERCSVSIKTPSCETENANYRSQEHVEHLDECVHESNLVSAV